MAKGKRRDTSQDKPEKDIGMAVREICLSFPQSEEIISHGSPNFRVIDGRIFATYSVNHHGDGHLALLLRMPRGAQSLYVDAEPEYFYVPAYSGPSGWLGVDLDKGLSWSRIAQLTREAYMEVAPKALSRDLGPAIDIDPPTRTIDPEAFDPFVSATASKRLEEVREVCLAYPETSEASQFGNPCFKAGKKTFVTLYFRDRKMYVSTWAGSVAGKLKRNSPMQSKPIHACRS